MTGKKKSYKIGKDEYEVKKKESKKREKTDIGKK